MKLNKFIIYNFKIIIVCGYVHPPLYSKAKQLKDMIYPVKRVGNQIHAVCGTMKIFISVRLYVGGPKR